MAEKIYLDFDLEIERTEQGYRIEADGPAGQAIGFFRLPFSDVELENFLLKIGHNKRGMRRVDSPEVTATKVLGSQLFDALFTNDLRACLRSSLDEASRQDAGLRIRLRLTGTPELADLPWEYLYHPALNRFLTLSVATPLVRYLELPERIRPLSVVPPLRMLVMISSPRGYPPLDVEREWVKLRGALSDLEARGLVVLERIPATLSALQQQLRRNSYHILHFIGHGGFDERTQDGVLLLEDADGESDRVSGQDLGTLLHDHRSLRLAMLNACEGGRGSRTDPFAGTAQSLVQQGLPAVIAMQFEVSDEAAIMLAHEFYQAIADSYPVDAAVAEARKALFAAGNRVEWGTPVLYLRAPDGKIFDVAPAAIALPAPAVAPPPVPALPPSAEPATENRTASQTSLKRSRFPTGWILATLAVLVVVGVLIASRRSSSSPSTTISKPIPTAPAPTAAALSASAVPAPTQPATSASAAPAPTAHATPLTAAAQSATQTAVAQAQAAAPTGRIAFDDIPPIVGVSAREIYVMNADGSALMNVTNNPADDRFPSWSPDGQRIAFVSNRGGNDDVYVMNVDGSGIAKLTNTPDNETMPAWSSDGSTIAFVSTHDRGAEIYLMRADGSEKIKLTDNKVSAFDTSPVWSPDGQKIAFLSYRNKSYGIYIMNADGSNQIRLTTSPESTPVLDWSPDGTKIAYQRGTADKSVCYVMNADGSEQTRFPDSTSVCSDLSWSPNGIKVVIGVGDELGTFIMNSDGTRKQELIIGIVPYNQTWSK